MLCRSSLQPMDHRARVLDIRSQSEMIAEMASLGVHSAATGWLAGEMIRRGAFQKIWKLVISGLLLGLICGALAAPVAAFVYGGTAGVGTGAIVSLFREMGASLLGSVTLQSFVSDPLDKLAVMAVVFAAVRALPKRTLRSFQPESRVTSSPAEAEPVRS